MPLESQAPWLRCLRTVCGDRGIELSALIESETDSKAAKLPVSIRETLDLVIVHAVFSRSLSLLARISIITAEQARNVHNIRAEMLLEKVPEARVVMDELIDTTFKFYSTTVLQEFGLSVARNNEPVPELEYSHFVAAFNMFDEPHLEGSVANPIISVLEVFTCRKYGFMFKSFPSAVRAVFVRLLQIITVPHPDFLGDFVEVQTSSAISALDLMNDAVRVPAHRQGESNIIRQLDRLNLLVSFALSSLAGLVQVNIRLMKDADYPVQPALPALPEIVSSDFLQNSCGALVQHILENPPVGSEKTQWILTPPSVTGEEPVSSDKISSKIDGISFISQQMRSLKCTFHMPDLDRPQSEWEEWFHTIRGLLDTFPHMPTTLLISCLTAQIKTTDQRIFGWVDKCSFLMHSQGRFSIEDWLDHVHTQVISTSTLRNAAYAELCELPSHLKHILDCVGLATKIKQLFKLIFPLIASNEREPCTWLQAILVVHNMLQSLGTSSGNCAKAWKLYDEYSPSADFRIYIKSSLHYTIQVSSDISHKYLNEKCHQLSNAHDQYTQTVIRSEPKRSILAINTGGYAGIKRFRE